jgi:5-methylcytosine-specific restriction endonuclease McrA
MEEQKLKLKKHWSLLPNAKEICKKISLSKIGKLRPDVAGSNQWNWKGGRPKCIECGKQLASYKAKRCHLHNNRLLLSNIEVREKMSLAMKGKTPVNFHKMQKIGWIKLKGRPLSEEHRRKLSAIHIKNREKSHLWKGGVTPKNHSIRNSTEYKLWRSKVFQRDDYTCQFCGDRGHKLNADHIKPFAYFPELRFDLSNGRTLCVACHRTTDTWGRPSLLENNKQLCNLN